MLPKILSLYFDIWANNEMRSIKFSGLVTNFIMQMRNMIKNSSIPGQWISINHWNFNAP